MGTSIIQPAVISDFLEQIVAKGGGASIDPEVKAQMVEDLRHRLENIIFATLLKALPPEQLPAFETLVAKPATQPEIETFLRAHIKNLDGLIAETLVSFQAMYLGNSHA